MSLYCQNSCSHSDCVIRSAAVLYFDCKNRSHHKYSGPPTSLSFICANLEFDDVKTKGQAVIVSMNWIVPMTATMVRFRWFQVIVSSKSYPKK